MKQDPAVMILVVYGPAVLMLCVMALWGPVKRLFK